MHYNLCEFQIRSTVMKYFAFAFVLCLATLSNEMLAQEPTPTPTPAKREDKSPHKSEFVTVNGVKLNYLDWGGSGEAVFGRRLCLE